MDTDLRDSYLRQVKGWRCEVKALGARITASQTPVEVQQREAELVDMKMRVRKVCDELKIPTTGKESIAKMVRLILDKVEQ